MAEPVYIPELCYRHRCSVVDTLGIREDGPWMAAILTTAINLFQAASDDERVRQRWSVNADGQRDTRGPVARAR